MIKEYFSHDYNARNDQKLVDLQMNFGLEGIGIYWCLIEMMYENGGFVLQSQYERIAFELRTDVQKIKSVLESDLFEKNGDKIISKSIQKRLEKRQEKSDQARQSANKRWEEYRRNANAKQTQCEGNAIIKYKDKVVKYKDKDSGDLKKSPSPEERKNNFYEKCAEYLDEYGKETIRAFYDYWTEMNEGGKKMRFEMQKVFEIKKRLATWKKKEINFSKKSVKISEEPGKFERMKERMKDEL